jgi:opacity protein-like surface antigen
MKKIALLLIAGTSVLSASLSHAEESNMYLGISGGLSLPLKSSFKIKGKDERTGQTQTIESKIKKSYMGTVDFGYRIAEGVAIEFSVDFKPKYPMKVNLPNNYGSAKTKASANIYMINFVYDFAKLGDMTPYFTAGVGLADVNLKSTSVTSAALGGATIFKLEKNRRKALAYQLGLGMQYPITDAISFDAAVKFQAITNVKIKYKKLNTANTTTLALVDKSTKQHLGVGEVVAGLVFNF